MKLRHFNFWSNRSPSETFYDKEVTVNCKTTRISCFFLKKLLEWKLQEINQFAREVLNPEITYSLHNPKQCGMEIKRNKIMFYQE